MEDIITKSKCIMADFFKKLNQIRSNGFITPVPSELDTQYTQVQLKNNIYKLKLLAIVMLVTKIISMIIYFATSGRIIQSGRLAQLLYSEQKIFNISNTYNLTFILLFILLIHIFSKKEKNKYLIVLCNLFIMLNYASVIITMIFVDTEIQILFLFSTTLFINMFIPNFKPKIFITTSILFYIITVFILAHDFLFYYSGGIQFFILNTFIAILIIKILHYNNNVKVFIEMNKIKTLNEKLSELSITDELTKLNNRRSFHDYYEIVWKQCQRLKLPLSVLLIDIDYFKKYNDSMGHLEGDNVLIAVSQCMKDQLKRETDFIARFGGEEFICLLPYIETENAFYFAQNLVKSIENLNIHHPMNESSKYITVSAGLASITPDENNFQKQLLDDADQALYRAKQTGRNRVIINQENIS